MAYSGLTRGEQQQLSLGEVLRPHTRGSTSSAFALSSYQEAQQHVEQQQEREGVRELDRHHRGVEQDASEALVEADEGHQEGDAQVAPGVPNLVYEESNSVMGEAVGA